MRPPLIVVTGTGTEIGKTHISRALLLAAQDASAHDATLGRVFGYKPVESGVVEGVVSDAELLDRASTFHVKHALGLRLRAGLSPHLAAELEGVKLDWARVAEFVNDLRAEGVAVLVELAGGLFSPLAPNLRNVDALGALDPTSTLLVAPNRLGVLHDVGAAVAGATHVGVHVDVVALVACANDDASAETNARELPRFVDVPVVGPIPRATPDDLARTAAMRVLYTHLVGRSR